MTYVEKWCREHNTAIEDRLPVLYAHGICHLLGYDHMDDKDYAQVRCGLVGEACKYNCMVICMNCS
jgi:ssRNA-specific RNase YbeY (16S rRNA maturation enzyme)